MSILMAKQREQGARQIVRRTEELLQGAGLTPVTIAWDLGKLDLNKTQHTLNVLVENGIVKEAFTNQQLEECFSYIRPAVDETLNQMLVRLVQQIKG
ncbi:MAG: hypothetical protein HUJ29_12915 [Gammaproteobacteria bacterium]|nr:hypothetical protein [Gammaproteobacteria bacterium]